MTLVWTTSANWTSYSYTWAQAEAAGAGSTASAARSHKAKPGVHVLGRGRRPT